MLLKGCVCVDLAVEGLRLAILSLYLALLMVTAVGVVWMFRRQRSSIREIDWRAPIPFLEHKSLKPTMKDFDKNTYRHPVVDLGKGILDQQIKEVDADESPNNVNFSQVLMSLECTTDGKLTAPQNKFEFSAFTEQCKLFANDLTAPSIDVNFSTIQPVERDDLDEIGKDFERGSSNMSCHGLFSNIQIMSAHIEAELNMTHTIVKNDEDMSITDIVHIPLQDVSKSASKDKKASFNNDWVADKENIAMNPYASPSETNVAVIEESDQVLVIDSKRLTLRPDMLETDKICKDTILPEHIKEELNMTHTVVKNDEDMSITNTVHSSLQDVSKSTPTDMKVSLNKDLDADKQNIASNPDTPASCESGEEPKHVVVFDVKRSILLPDKLEEDKDYRKTLLPNSSAENPQCLILDVNGDLPKSIDGMLNSKLKKSDFSSSRTRRKENKRDENKITDTVPVHKVVITPKYEKASKRETIVFNDSTCNMSVAQALPVNMILPDKQTQQKCRTIKYENDSGNFSDTQKFSINIILPNNNTSPGRQQTVLQEDLENPEPRLTIVYEDDTNNISVTQALLSNTLPEKVKFGNNKENNEAENNIKDRQGRGRMFVYENDTGNISIPQVKQQLKPGYGKEKPIVHVTTSSTSNKPRSKKRTTIDNDISANIKTESKNEKKSIVYDENPASISMGLAIIANNYLLEALDSAVDIKISEEIEEVKEKVIGDDIVEKAFNNTKTIACGDVDSKSLVISTNFYLLDKLDSAADITKPIINSQVIDNDVFDLKPTEDALQDNRKSTVFVANKFDSEPSMIMGIATVPSLLQTEKRRTVIYNHKCNISKKHPTPAESISDETESLFTAKTKLSNPTKQNLAANPQSDIIVLQAIPTNSEQLTASISEQINLMDPLYRDPTLKVQKANNWKVATPKTQKVLSLPEIPVSAIVMPVHPGIEKVLVKLITSTTDRMTKTVSEGDDDSIAKESLSNISYQSLQRATYDKSLMAILESDPSSDVIPHDASASTSTESMFYIMKDSEVVTQTDRKMNNKAKKANPNDEEEQVVHLQRQLSELKTAIQNSAISSRLFEIDTRNEHVNFKPQSDNSSRLSDTQDLLDLISNFTGSVTSEYNVQPFTIKVEDQHETIDRKQFSVALNEQSTTLGGEDFLRNILSQTSLTCEEKFSPLKKTAFSELTCEEKFSSLKKTAVTSLTCEEKFSPLKKTAVAGLTYEDKFSPLKKTAFGETSYMYETKEKVIPTCFKDVSSGIKELMVDLVNNNNNKKPVSNDNSQIRLIDRDETQNTSTCSVQIQADLAKSRHSAAVLIFDHLNPLNNVLLGPNYSKNGQNPSQMDETRYGSGKLLKKISKGNNYETETFTTTQFTMMPEPSTMQDITCVYQKDDRFNKKDDQFSSQSTIIGRISVDQSADAISGKRLNKISKGNNYEAETFTTTQFTMMPEPSTMQDITCVYQKDDRFNKKDDQFSSQSTIIGRISVDQSADAISGKLLNKISKGNNYEAETFTTTQFTMMPEPSTMQDITCVYQKDDRFNKKDDQFSSQSTIIGRMSVDQSADAISGKLLNKISKGNNYEMETFTTTQFTMTPEPSKMQDNTCIYQREDRFNKKDDQFISQSTTTSGSISVDQPGDAISGKLLKKISKGNNYEAETFTTTQFTMMPEPSTMQDITCVYQKDDRFNKKDDQFSSQSTTSGRISVDQSADAISRKLLKKISTGNNYEAETFTTTQFTMMPEPSTMQHDVYVYQKDDGFSKKDDQFSLQSTTSESISVDKSADAISNYLRNEKVNSIMQMRKNEELFEASLPLELVDDASQDANRALTSDSNKHKNLKLKFSISPHVNIQGEAAKIVKAATVSGVSIRQRFSCSNSRVSVTNCKTWIDCSPSADKHEQYSPSEEMTPKPITTSSKSSNQQKVSAVLSSPDEPTKSLRTEEMFFIFVDQSFRPADPVFDRLTSVNNVLHSPSDLTDAHKNDPRKTDQTLFGSASSFNEMSRGDYEVDEALTTMQNTMEATQHTENTLTELLNTLHALVNEKSENENCIMTPDNKHSTHRINLSRSILVDSEGQAAGRRQYNRTKKRVNSVKNGRKQISIPSTDKHKKYSPSVKVTRKPIKKISTNPKPRIVLSTDLYSADDFKDSLASEKDVTETYNRDAHSSTICEKKSPGTTETSVFSVHKPCKSVVLEFDLLNPLNNILLAPACNMEVHKYNPRHTDETVCGSGSHVSKISKCNDNDVETVTTTLYTRTPEPKKKRKNKRNIYLRK